MGRLVLGSARRVADKGRSVRGTLCGEGDSCRGHRNVGRETYSADVNNVPLEMRQCCESGFGGRKPDLAVDDRIDCQLSNATLQGLEWDARSGLVECLERGGRIE